MENRRSKTKRKRETFWKICDRTPSSVFMEQRKFELPDSGFQPSRFGTKEKTESLGYHRQRGGKEKDGKVKWPIFNQQSTLNMIYMLYRVR